MTLPFSLFLADKTPTYFPQKIMSSLMNGGIMTEVQAFEYFVNWKKDDRLDIDLNGRVPKDHTIRLDLSERWRKDNKIHFVIGNRTKERYQFAPVVPCTGTQSLFMSLNQYNELEVSLEDKYLYKPELEVLAKRDGFDSYEAFESWFITFLKGQPDQCAHTKIIHWTNELY
ncbi:MAG: hypothetical protein RIC03_06880 [Cyclobacteriaceae bacterium]